jgi:hypothetical protein
VERWGGDAFWFGLMSGIETGDTAFVYNKINRLVYFIIRGFYI